MLPIRSSGFVQLGLLALVLNTRWVHAADPIEVSAPSIPNLKNVVYSNFLGLSMELSFMDQYFGNDTSTIPQTMINYLTALRVRTGSSVPLRLRIGGNSMDSSTYVPTQQSPMVQLTDPNANANDQPVNYGPMLWDVIKKVGDSVGGIDYLIGLTLMDTTGNNPIIAGTAEKTLGKSLDALLLGNEPDLYTAHNERPLLKNYTVQNYIDEYSEVSDRLKNTSAGNILDLRIMAGPTICCSWDLATLLQQGYLTTFDHILKYVTLQHYPQNNCFDGKHEYELPYYLQHANAVGLAAWQKHGIDILLSNTSSNRPQLILSEFNSASCGGIPGISDTFGAGTLWTVDYGLQMASVGYSAAYLHTREAGIVYNIVDPPVGQPGPWKTNPTYYALLAASEIVPETGGIVVDLNLNGSMSDKSSQVGGYAIVDSKNSTVNRLVIFNFANASMAATRFSIPASLTPDVNKGITVKFLTSPTVNDNVNIAWGGQTLVGVGDGKPVPVDHNASAWALPNQHLDCNNGCSVDVPGPGMAVVFLDGTQNNLNNNGGVGANQGHQVLLMVLGAILVSTLAVWW